MANRPLRIGVDATCWANSRGYGRFARELVQAMTQRAPADHFICFGDRRALQAWPHPSPNVKLVEVPLDQSPTIAAAATSSRSVRDMLRLTRAVAREPMDVFFSPSVYTYFPLPPRLPAVVTIHDTIPERFPHLTLPSARARFFWSLKVRVALAQSRMVLTVSEYSADSITRILGVPRERIRVCVEAPAAPYHPAEAHEVVAVRKKLGLPDEARWFAYVGGFNPHKRVDLILRAHATLAESRQPAPHVILVGDRSGDVFHAEGAKLDAIVREAGTTHLVHWTGFLPDDDLRPVLAGATALLLPSEAEGFGLPAVEAAACGAPVIATLESPLPGILAGGGFFVKPGELEPLTMAMYQLHDDPGLRAKMAQAALARASALSWSTGADQAMGAIRDSVR